MIKERKLIGGNLTGYYKKNGRYEINEKEAPIITYLFETYASGNKGLVQIGLVLQKCLITLDIRGITQLN